VDEVGRDAKGGRWWWESVEEQRRGEGSRGSKVDLAKEHLRTLPSVLDLMIEELGPFLLLGKFLLSG